jgi:hypothetical protein
MKQVTPHTWVHRFAAIRRGKASLTNQVEKIGAVSVRLEELHQDLEQIHSKIESLEIELQGRRGSRPRNIPFPHLEDLKRLHSDYWIG